MNEALQNLSMISSIITPFAIIPIYHLVKTLTDIKIDIAKLKQATGVE